jgi:hypothetical protein
MNTGSPKAGLTVCSKSIFKYFHLATPINYIPAKLADMVNVAAREFRPVSSNFMSFR